MFNQPEFDDATVVYAMYCDGGSWTGSNSTSLPFTHTHTHTHTHTTHTHTHTHTRTRTRQSATYLLLLPTELNCCFLHHYAVSVCSDDKTGWALGIHRTCK
jgi:hypothetical protein